MPSPPEPFADLPNPLTLYAQARISFASKQLAKKFGLSWDRRLDVEQDLSLDLWLALKKYDAEKGAQRSTFISRVVNRRCMHLKRDLCREKARRPRSLQTVCESRDNSRLISVDDLTHIDQRNRLLGRRRIDSVEHTDQTEAVAIALAGLEPRLRRIALLLMTNKQADVAEEFGVSATSIDRARKQIKKHFERVGLKKLFEKP